MSKFDNWWQHVPRRVGKIACRKSYARQVRILEKEQPDDDPHEILLTAIKAYAVSKRVKEGYVTNPLTWLNQGRYYDDLEPAEQPRESVSRMDETTKAEMARARRVKSEKIFVNGSQVFRHYGIEKPRSKPAMNFDLTKAFDAGWKPPKGWYFPIADPYRQRIIVSV